MMPPPTMTTRAWVGKSLMLPPRAKRGEVARSAGGVGGHGPWPLTPPSAQALGYKRRNADTSPSRTPRRGGSWHAPSQPPRQRCVVHAAHLGYAGLHRIASGRRIDCGHFGEPVEMAFRDAEFGQRVRNADLATQLQAPFHEAIEGRLVEAEPARQSSDLLVDGRSIEFQHIGHRH